MSESIESTITHLNRRVMSLVESGDHHGALDLAVQSLELTGTRLGRDTQAFATSLNNLAAVHYQAGRYSEAVALFQRAIDLEHRIVGETPDFATLLNNVAEVYVDVGDFVRAREMYERALAIDRRYLGDDQTHLAIVLQNLASLDLRLGESGEAERRLDEAMAILARAPDKSGNDLAVVSNSVGLMHSMKGDYGKAERRYREALRFLGDDGSPVLRAKCLENLAGVYERIGDYTQAEKWYLEALAIVERSFGPEHVETATVLNALGYLYQSMRKFGEAVSYYEQALEVRRRALGESHPDVSASLNNLASVYYDSGRFSEAVGLARRVLAMARNNGFAPHHIARSLNNLGMICLAAGDRTEAEPLLEEALAIRRSLHPSGHPDVSETLVNLAACYVTTDRATTALRLMTEAARQDDLTLDRASSFASEAQRLDYLARMRKYFDAFVSLVVASLSGSQDAVNSACDIALRRKAITAEGMAIQNEVVLGGRYPELAPKLHRLRGLRAQIAAAALDAIGRTTQQESRLVADWQREAEKLESDLGQAVPEMALSSRLRAADTRAVATSLEDDTVLIEFVRVHSFDFTAVPAKGETQWRAPRYVAFLVAGGCGEVAKMIDLGETDVIDRLIARLLGTIRGTANREGAPAETRHLGASDDISQGDAAKAGADLRRAVFDPLIPALGGRTRLIVSPDSALCRVPFEALSTADGGYLVDTYRISYVSTGRDVLRFGVPPSGMPGAPMVLADPDFELSADASIAGTAFRNDAGAADASERALRGAPVFSRLPGTRREGERVGALLGVTPLMDRGALESAVKACQSPRILHLATHGFFLPALGPDAAPQSVQAEVPDSGGNPIARLASQENPLLRSGLALAGANAWLQRRPTVAEAEDGILTALDVTGLDLVHTQLAVLSACDTGVGQVRTGEGVFGLRRAFVLAGVRTLIVSLWKVPDDATQRLMVDFYQRAMDGTPAAEALRLAQQSLKGTYPDISYWGAFICQGDPRPLLRRTEAML